MFLKILFPSLALLHFKDVQTSGYDTLWLLWLYVKIIVLHFWEAYDTLRLSWLYTNIIALHFLEACIYFISEKTLSAYSQPQQHMTGCSTQDRTLPREMYLLYYIIFIVLLYYTYYIISLKQIGFYLLFLLEHLILWKFKQPSNRLM